MLLSTLYPAHSSFAVLLLLLLSVVFEVMVMATPIAVRNAIANPSQLERRDLKHGVVLRRRDNKDKAIRSKLLEDDENWYLYIGMTEGFYAVPVSGTNDQWKVLNTNVDSQSGIKLGSISFPRTQVRTEFYEEIPQLKLPSNCGKYKAIDIILEYIGADERKAKGIVFNPEEGDPWQIYTAMTNPKEYTGGIYRKLPKGQKRKKSKPPTSEVEFRPQNGGAEGSNVTHDYSNATHDYSNATHDYYNATHDYYYWTNDERK
ncbi:hypothetical protein C8R41DRAFT_915715 [Lentinula lateritia]|uniref:Uncharacterized protein n=1 Tax=Lentinula lateritia TaxID=40482 RepID=A0ABQ8VSY1_9AGAR|nr:hypothetical protein C8R41DRAFT_915715 [Lentinula lateritia]